MSGYGDAVRRLGAAQKSSKGGQAYSIYVNRRLGRYTAAAAFQLGLTPNQVTAISAVCSAAAIAVIAFVSGGWAALAAPLLAAGYVFDAADGQLARLRGGGSLTGEWLDHVVDAVKTVSLHLVVLIHLFRFTDLDDRWLLVPIAFAIVDVTLFFVQLLNDQLRRQRGVKSASDLAAVGERKELLRSLSKLPHDYGALCWVFVLLPWPHAFLVVYGAFAAFNALYLVLGLVKWFGQMQEIDAGGAA